MTVYRVQDKDGRGPFRPGMTAQWLDAEPKAHQDRLQAWTQQFGFKQICQRRKPEEAMGCACDSLNQLRLWFSETEMKELKKLGYQVVKLEADRVLGHSAEQVVFVRKRPLREGVEVVELYPGKGTAKFEQVAGYIAAGRARGSF
jgi:hypothetical protein